MTQHEYQAQANGKTAIAYAQEAIAEPNGFGCRAHILTVLARVTARKAARWARWAREEQERLAEIQAIYAARLN